MGKQIEAGMLKHDLLAAVVRGIDLDQLQVLTTEQPGVLLVTGQPTMQVRMTIARFETEGDQLQLVSHEIGDGTLTQVIEQFGVSVRQSVSLLNVPPDEMVCVGCLYLSYEADNTDAWNAATAYIYVTDIELVSL